MKYIEIVKVYQKLESTSKRLEKTYYISQILTKAKGEELHDIILLFQGKVFPDYEEKKIGVAAKLIMKALVLATGISQKQIENEWIKTGDLGEVAKRLIPIKKQKTLFSIDITLSKVCSNIRKLADLEGQGTVDKKVKLIAELLTSATAEEAKYITRTVLETLRVGVGASAIRDAIMWSSFPKVAGIFFQCRECGAWVPNAKACMECDKAIETKFNPLMKKLAENKPKEMNILEIKGVDEIKNPEDYDLIIAPDEKTAREIYNYLINIIQRAYDVTNDFGKVARTAKEKGMKGLLEIDLTVGVPINVMLYKKAKNINDAFNTVGKPCACEYKYDGFRLQIHRNGEIIKLVTRRLEDVTNQFPDVVESVKKNIESEDYIIDCEIIGIDPKTKKWLPFQNISQRIKRKYEIIRMTKEIPVVVKIFDAMEIGGKNLLNEKFSQRREMLTKIVKEEKDKINLAKQVILNYENEVDKFYEESLAQGNEGIMMKNMDAPYKPGSRVGYGVKIKPVMESLDLTIIKAEWGEGKRSGWLTSYTVACIDEDGNFLEIGKVGTGLKEKDTEGLSFAEMTEELKERIIASKGRNVTIKPETVLEIEYEEIQKSPNYKSGFALRFPRIKSKRDDMRADEISTLEQIEELYHVQKAR
ncbi:MAG: ATP-dependent DNA ligase [Nanoarchaeota archaeon]|nr:ATP-dependent DNA ligase [Nanoarchaeota archaeon]